MRPSYPGEGTEKRPPMGHVERVLWVGTGLCAYAAVGGGAVYHFCTSPHVTQPDLAHPQLIVQTFRNDGLFAIAATGFCLTVLLGGLALTTTALRMRQQG